VVIEKGDAAISLQEGKDGKAKAYQVRQLLDRIDDYGLGPKEDWECFSIPSTCGGVTRMRAMWRRFRNCRA
jgi:hypothetical protein